MFVKLKLNIISLLVIFLFFSNLTHAEEEEIYLKAISDQIQVITKDLKTLEKAVYQKSDIVSLKPSSKINSDGLNEDIMTKHLLKLNEIEDQFRELTNKFEEVNFKLDKLSTRVTKIQSDTQLRFSDLETGTEKTQPKKMFLFPEQANHKILVQLQVTKHQTYLKNSQLIQLKAHKPLLLRNLKKEIQYYLISLPKNNTNLQLVL